MVHQQGSVISMETVKVGRDKIGNNLACLTAFIIWSGFYLSGYASLNNANKQTNLSRLLLIHMLMIFFVALEFVANLIVNHKLFDKSLPTLEYKSKLCFDSKYYAAILFVINIMHEIISIILVMYFIPYTVDNCHGYTLKMCINGRVGAFVGLICLISYGIFVFLVIIQSTILRCFMDITSLPIYYLTIHSILQKTPVVNKLVMFKPNILFYNKHGNYHSTNNINNININYFKRAKSIPFKYDKRKHYTWLIEHIEHIGQFEQVEQIKNANKSEPLSDLEIDINV